MVSRDQRKRQLAREKWERQQRRRAEQRARRRRQTVVISAVLAAVLGAGGTLLATGALSGGDEEDGKKKVAAEKTSEPSKAPDPCREPASGKPGKKQWKKEPPLTVDRDAKYAATLDTTCGRITLELDPAKAPHTVNSFAFLAGQKFFDHTKCHRLTSQGIFVLQCGDPEGTGQGGPGYQLKDENLKDPSVAEGTYPAGTVAMANAGPDTGGSQFFLVYKDSALPPNYTPFGKITGGTRVLEKIAAAGEQTGQGDGPPNATVVIDEFRVSRA